MQLTYQIIKKKFNNQPYFKMTATFYLPLTNYVIHTQEVKTIEQLHELAHEILKNYHLKTVNIKTENDYYTVNLPHNLDKV